MNIRRGDIVKARPGTDLMHEVDPGTTGTVVGMRFGKICNKHMVLVRFPRKSFWGRTPFPCFLNEIKVVRRKNR